MEKIAPTQFPIHELLARRWSPRAFSPRKVEPGVLMQLFEAARWAASSFNEQPWSFILALNQDENEYTRLLSCLVPGNQVWAQHAPALMLSVARLSFARNMESNRHAFHDVGMAVQNLSLQATALGLSVHHMAGFDVERARELFGVPQGYEPVAIMAVGYQGEARSLPEKLRAREEAARTRKSLDEFVFAGHWGLPASLVVGEK